MGAMNNVAELLRLLHNLIRTGTVAEVDHEAARVRVQAGGNLTTWLPWLEARAGSTRTWSPPTVGEQVMVLSPDGDLAGGIVLTGIYQEAHPAPSSSPAKWQAVMPDGAVLEYDHQASHLRATLPGSAEVNAPGGLVIHADTTINGAVSINGDSLTHNGKNVGDTHQHSGVASGSSNTGEPV